MTIHNYSKMASFTNGHDNEETQMVEDNRFKNMDLVALATELGKIQRQAAVLNEKVGRANEDIILKIEAYKKQLMEKSSKERNKLVILQGNCNYIRKLMRDQLGTGGGEALNMIPPVALTVTRKGSRANKSQYSIISDWIKDNRSTYPRFKVADVSHATEISSNRVQHLFWELKNDGVIRNAGLEYPHMWQMVEDGE